VSEESVRVGRGGVARLAGVEDDDVTARASQDERRAQSGRATADDGDVDLSRLS
jgi:hypothetical protein